MTNVLKVRTPAQKAIFEQELQGQISDGYWENDSTDSRLWDCEVVVSDEGTGCNFTPLYPIAFSELDYVLERAVEIGKSVEPDYNMERLMEDLEELTAIVFG